MLGDGIVSFGTAVVTALCRNTKSSAKIGSSSRTRDRTAMPAEMNAVSPAAPCIRTSMRSSVRSMPPILWMKSMCHAVRRNSPSVAACNPTRSCMATTSRIALSSAARSTVMSISPASCAARVASSAGGRSRLPTWSARNGGSVRDVMRAG